MSGLHPGLRMQQRQLRQYLCYRHVSAHTLLTLWGKLSWCAVNTLTVEPVCNHRS